MAQKKKRNPRYVTPEGIAVWPYLIEPDDYQGTLTYKTELRVAPDAELFEASGKSVGSFQEFLDKKCEEAFKRFKEEFKGKKDKRNRPIKVEEADPPYYFDENGELVVKFKLNAEGKTREGKEFTQQPALFDSRGKPFTEDELWGGSRIKVSFEIVPYHMASTNKAGISLRLKAVQVIELVSGGTGASAESYGFGVEESEEDEDMSSDFDGSTEEEDEEEEDDLKDF